MVMDPDPSTFAVLPWYEGAHKTARFFVDVYEGGSHERFTRDSRYMAQRAAQFAGDQGYDTTYWGPEIEFFVFDGIRMLPTADAVRNPWSGAGYEIISREAPWQEIRKSTRLNSSHLVISYAVFCLKKKKNLPHRNVDST